MSSRYVRIPVVLLALAQLVVWGFYAPAHRLQYHSHLQPVAGQAVTHCHSHCCGHHHHAKGSTPVAPESTPVPHDQCPDDDQHCGLCILALAAGCSSDVVELVGLSESVSPLVVTAGIEPSIDRVDPFETRGPPSA